MKEKLNELEEFLKKRILPDLEKGRGDFDKIHTIEVVNWIKQIIANNPDLNLDKSVLVIAAYAHDWGYYGLFGDKKNLNAKEVDSARDVHMKIGAEKLKKLLKNNIFSFLTNAQKNRCIHLVAIHDKKYKLKDTDELVLMEADTLSGLDVSGGKPVFDAKSNIMFMKSMTVKISKFITNFSKNEARKLIQKREEYFKRILK